MAVTFRIPKQNDRDILCALGRIRQSLTVGSDFRIHISIPSISNLDLNGEAPQEEPSVKLILDVDSVIISNFYLRESRNKDLIKIERQWSQTYDSVTLPDDGFNRIDEPNRRQLYVEVLASARKELKAPDIEAAFRGSEENSWNQYREAQAAVLNSLQQTAETLLVKTANSNAELELARSARFEKLEAELRTTLTDERTKLYAELDSQRNALLAQEKALSEKQASFNTKEARYVARQKQEEQITQIQEWLKDWTLTKGTARKRWPIVVGYVVALLGTGILTWYATAHNYSILKSTDDLTKLQWWHWVLLTSKSFFPLAAFTTFMVYFIRWSSAWARQHSEEEFRNRTRLVDIGRSSWLLEAVRDAQDKGTQIPPELLKELSRNLFSTSIHPDGELAPQALSEVLLQGLSSLRVKSPDGSEIEATRKKL